jgi:hypothetical protein
VEFTQLARNSAKTIRGYKTSSLLAVRIRLSGKSGMGLANRKFVKRTFAVRTHEKVENLREHRWTNSQEVSLANI